MMRKILSCFISVLVILSTVNVQIFAKTTSNDVGKAQKAVDLLTVMQAYSAENADENITKGEFTDIVIKATRAGEWADSADVIIKDVENDYPYTESSQKAVKLGFAENSGWNAAITRKEALKILIDAMGYGDYGKSQSGYEKLARQVGITASATGKNGTLVRDDALRLIYEALNSTYLEFETKSQGKIRYRLDESRTFLSGRLKIYHKFGIMDSTQYSSLSGAPSVSENCVSISGESYESGMLNVDYLLGYAVEFYYTEDNDRDTLLVLWKNNENSIEISSDDIIDYANGTYSYYDEKGRVKYAKVTSDADYIYNGAVTTTYTDDILIPETGTVTLVDNNGKYSLVVINSFKMYFTDVASGSIGVYDKNRNEMFKFDTDDSLVSYAVVDSLGNSIQLTDIKANSVLSVAEAKVPDGSKIINVIVSDRTAKGTLTSDWEDYVTIGGEKIRKSDYYKKYVKNIAPGDSVTVYFDFNNEAVFAKKSVPDNSVYTGFIMAFGSDNGPYEKLILKTYTTAGEVMQNKLADSVRVDEYTFKDTKKLYDYIRKDGKFNCDRVIKFRLNSENEVCVIDTTIRSDKEGSNSLSNDTVSVQGFGNKTMQYSSFGKYFSNNTLGRVYNVGDNSIMMCIPDDEKDYNNASRFSIMNIKGIANNTNLYIDSVYNRNDNCEAELFVIKGTGQGTSNDAFVVSNVGEAYDEASDEIVKLVEGFVKGEEKSYFVEDDIFEKTPIKCGDILQHGANSQTGYITDYKIKFSIQDNKIHPREYGQDILFEKQFACLYGKCYVKSTSMMQVMVDKKAVDDSGKTDTSKIRYMSFTDSVPVFKYNSDKKKLERGDLSDVYDYRLKGNNASELFLVCSYSTIMNIIIAN